MNRSDDGFNRCFLVCICPGNKENHEVIQAYLDDMGFVPGEWLLCSDLKVNNICCGLMGHSARHPCYACSWESGKEEDEATLRTFENVRENNEKWQSSGSNPSTLKNFQNCRTTAVSLFPLVGAILFLIPPSSLHLIIGVFNHLFSGAESVCALVLEWPRLLHVVRADYHGQKFEGRPCRKLLSNVNVLRTIICEDSSNNSEIHPLTVFADAFEAFQTVIQKCFGRHLDSSFDVAIEEFKIAYIRTGDKKV